MKHSNPPHYRPSVRLPAAVLRRSTPFLGGFLAGLFILAPFSVLLLIALHANHRLDIIPTDTADAIPLEACDYVSLPRLIHATDDGSLFLSGSSELQSDGESEFIDLVSAERRIIPIGDKGSGIIRAVSLIERLRPYNRRPRGIIVVINTHYATSANKPADSVSGLYFDPDSRFLHDEDVKGDFPTAGLPVRTRARFRILQRCAAAGSLFFDRLIQAQFRTTPEAIKQSEASSEVDPAWGIPASLIPHGSQVAVFREERRVSRNLIDTDFGRYAVKLRQAAEASHIPIRVLVMPFHPLFTARIGLDPGEENSSLLRQTQHILGPSIAVVPLTEFKNARHFRDSIHFTKQGRKLLAEIIEREAGFIR